MSKTTWERKLELCIELNALPELTDAVREVVRMRREIKSLQATAYAEANKNLTLGSEEDYALGEEQKHLYLALTRILDGE